MEPTLRFRRAAWEKLCWMRDRERNEVGGWGVTAADDRLLVEDVVIIPQKVSMASVDFDDEGVAMYVTEMLKKGISPDRCFRVWIHTHPGNSAVPSSTDQDTFKKVLGEFEWSVMFILAHGGNWSARLRVRAANGLAVERDLEVRMVENPPTEEQVKLWTDEFEANVKPKWFGTTATPASATIEIVQHVGEKRGVGESKKAFKRRMRNGGGALGGPNFPVKSLGGDGLYVDRENVVWELVREGWRECLLDVEEARQYIACLQERGPMGGTEALVAQLQKEQDGKEHSIIVH